MTKTINGRYRLDERIGAGGMGEVWRGEDLTLHRTVAVKMLHANLRDNSEQQARFEAEARTLAQIHHANVVDIYDFGQSEGSAFLVMEFVPGRSLGDILRDEKETMTVERTAGIVVQAAQALNAVHKRGIVHRDIKPDNLIVKEDGTVVLTDFGIARTDMSMTLTADGTVIGTAYYMAPEQVSGERPVPASDQYSLGIVTYRCIVGELPFDGTTPMSVAIKQLRDPVPDLPESTPPALAAAVLRSLRKKPEDRYPDCLTFAKALNGLIPKGETTASMAAITPLTDAPLTRVMPKTAAPAAKTTKIAGAAAVPVRTPKEAKAALRAAAASPPAAPPPARVAGSGSGKSKTPIFLAVAAAVVVVVLGAVLLSNLGGDNDGTGGDTSGNLGGDPGTSETDNSGGDNTGDGSNEGDDNTGDESTDPEHSDNPDSGGEPSDDGGDEGGDDEATAEVPPVSPPGSDMNVPDARAWVEKRGLAFKVKLGDGGDGTKCTSYTQEPAAGTMLKPGETVEVFYNEGCKDKFDEQGIDY
ncbi:serine/threonine protein kinase [Phytomonospora sp. NPDC050363]|uniref:serine/threonine protein kinase n=1 Tax=Phytomonospora sp. NPDC050363 TaxID=3155642 RepID=UPI0033C182D9